MSPKEPFSVMVCLRGRTFYLTLSIQRISLGTMHRATMTQHHVNTLIHLCEAWHKGWSRWLSQWAVFLCSNAAKNAQQDFFREQNRIAIQSDDRVSTKKVWVHVKQWKSCFWRDASSENGIKPYQRFSTSVRPATNNLKSAALHICCSQASNTPHIHWKQPIWRATDFKLFVMGLKDVLYWWYAFAPIWLDALH